MKKYEKMTLKMALQLAAPHTWVASILPALFGIFFCQWIAQPLGMWKNILMILACILFQASVNTLNDYVDYVKGNDKAEDCVEASDAVLLYHKIKPKSVFNLGMIYLFLGAGIGSIASLQGGILPFIIGCVGAGIVILYSCAGAVSISYLPLGEIVSGLVMGSMIPLGIVAASTGKFYPEVFVLSAPLALGIALIMMSNNACDIEKDTEAKRYTLAVVVLGREQTRKRYQELLVVWLLLLILFSVFQFGIFGGITLLIVFTARGLFLFLLRSSLLLTAQK